MIYQETINIPNKKAKAILELCKRLGIELFDAYDGKEKSNQRNSSVQQINEYLTEYYSWYKLTSGHLEKIFLTPRIPTEFAKKDVFGTTFRLNIQAHLDSVLVHQIYFIELIINEIKEYKFTADKTATERQGLLKKIFVVPAKSADN